MTPNEIRELTLGPNRLNSIAFFLREIAAQMAEANEIARSQQAHTKAAVKLGGAPAVRSSVRVQSGTKRFYVDRWKSAVESNMLPEFMPKEGFKEIEDLLLEEWSEGRLGADDNGRIKRVA